MAKFYQISTQDGNKIDLTLNLGALAELSKSRKDLSDRYFELYKKMQGKNGGLKGISGTSGDMRDIEAAIESGSERAELALKVLATHILRYIGAYSMEIGGLDAVAFTGGIGENCVRLRRMVLEGMAHLGLEINPEANERGSGERLVTQDSSKIAAYVIPANEEFMVVRETYRICKENNC